jgi:hypothetical protein
MEQDGCRKATKVVEQDVVAIAVAGFVILRNFLKEEEVADIEAVYNRFMARDIPVPGADFCDMWVTPPLRVAAALVVPCSRRGIAATKIIRCSLRSRSDVAANAFQPGLLTTASGYDRVFWVHTSASSSLDAPSQEPAARHQV